MQYGSVQSPRLTGRVRVTLSKPLHLSGLLFPLLHQVHMEPGDPYDFLGKQ